VTLVKQRRGVAGQICRPHFNFREIQYFVSQFEILPDFLRGFPPEVRPTTGCTGNSSCFAFGEILAAWRCRLIEFGGEADHVHLLVDIHPALDISVLINNLKTASARRARNRFADHLAPFYRKPLLWNRAYFVGSVGGVTLQTVRAYVDAQGTAEHARKSAAKAGNKPAR
jgi:putative transposase